MSQDSAICMTDGEGRRFLRPDEIRLFGKLKGCVVSIPDLCTLLPSTWHHAQPEHWQEMRDSIDSWLLRWSDDGKIRKLIKAADLTLFASAAYPTATEDRIVTCARWAGWAVMFDDEVDCGNLAFKPEATKEYLDDARACVLDLKAHGVGHPARKILQAYCDVNAEVKAKCSSAANTRVLNHILGFIDAVDARHGACPDEFLPVDEYISLRRDTSAVYGLVFLIEYAYDLDLPDSFFKHADVKTLIDRTTDLVALMNDLISFPKEVRDLELENLVALISHHEDASAQEAIWRAVALIRQCVDAFSQAEQSVLVSVDTDARDSAQRFITGCKHIVYGNAFWSMQSKRYMARAQDVKPMSHATFAL